MTARHGEVLLLHSESHVDPVCDALTVREDQRWAPIRFGLAKRIEGLLWVCAHCDSRDVHVAVRDCLHCQIFARCAFSGGGELRDRAKRRRFGGLSTSVGVDLGVENEYVDVASRRQHVIESAVADVIGPSIAAHQPDAAADKMVDDREQITRALGWGVGAWLLPGHSVYVHAFLGATLCATSVGITARVLKDVSRLQTREARIILGAAVLDDVMGLVVLAVVTGMIGAADRGGSFSSVSVAMIILKAAAFLVVSLFLGVRLSPRLFQLASRLHARGVLLALGLALCFLMSWLANVVGLAPIVGAFAAGLVLEDVHYRSFVDRGEHPLEDLIHPISGFLAPVFFVLMGLRTDLRSFAAPGVLGLAAALTLVAVLGKQACSLGAWGRGVDRLTVGLGMIPRGEVGLIFANIGVGLTVGGEPIIDRGTFSAVVVMVIVTTLVTPIALKFSLQRADRRRNS